jgi:S-adenosylmethionine:diacylglycerol 3-amino-3-carboxypropyl transferase
MPNLSDSVHTYALPVVRDVLRPFLAGAKDDVQRVLDEYAPFMADKLMSEDRDFWATQLVGILTMIAEKNRVLFRRGLEQGFESAAKNLFSFVSALLARGM